MQAAPVSSTPAQGAGDVTDAAGTSESGIHCVPLAEADIAALKAKLRMAAQSLTPAIFKKGAGEAAYLVHNMGIRVADWGGVKGNKVTLPGPPPNAAPTKTGKGSRAADRQQQQQQQNSLNPAPKLSRAIKSKANGAGRQYTSKFRGVHQTFPTKRWEAQFRRNGKPTSLGCFDHEEEAARAYDKMMLWSELHNTSGTKGGITNYDPSEYDKDIAWLQTVSQDDLIEALRSDGRRQAAHRMLRQKREGAPSASGRSVRARTSREGTSERDYSEDGMGHMEGSVDASQADADMEGLSLPSGPNSLAPTPASITDTTQAHLIANAASLIPSLAALAPAIAALPGLTGQAELAEGLAGLQEGLAGLPALQGLTGVGNGGDLQAAAAQPQGLQDTPMSL